VRRTGPRGRCGGARAAGCILLVTLCIRAAGGRFGVSAAWFGPYIGAGLIPGIKHPHKISSPPPKRPCQVEAQRSVVAGLVSDWERRWLLPAPAPAPGPAPAPWASGPSPGGREPQHYEAAVGAAEGEEGEEEEGCREGGDAEGSCAPTGQLGGTGPVVVRTAGHHARQRAAAADAAAAAAAEAASNTSTGAGQAGRASASGGAGPVRPGMPVAELAAALVEAKGKLEALQRGLAEAQGALDAAYEQLEVAEAKMRACQQQAAAAAAAPQQRRHAGGGRGGGGSGGPGTVFAVRAAASPLMQAVAALRGVTLAKASRQVAALYTRTSGGRGGGDAAAVAAAAASDPGAASGPRGAPAAAGPAGGGGGGSSGGGGGSGGSLMAGLQSAAYPLLNLASAIGSQISGILVAGVGSSAAVALGTSLGLLRLGIGVVKFLVQVGTSSLGPPRNRFGARRHALGVAKGAAWAMGRGRKCEPWAASWPSLPSQTTPVTRACRHPRAPALMPHPARSPCFRRCSTRCWPWTLTQWTASRGCCRSTPPTRRARRFAAWGGAAWGRAAWGRAVPRGGQRGPGGRRGRGRHVRHTGGARRARRPRGGGLQRRPAAGAAGPRPRSDPSAPPLALWRLRTPRRSVPGHRRSARPRQSRVR
jgi:hypothetical protein